MKIAVFTHYDTYFEPVAAITVPVMREYCERHGYHFEAVTERKSERRVVWDKVSILLANLGRFDHICFLDTDILITNVALPLNMVLPPFFCDVVLSQDVHGWNMGFIMVRSSDDVKEWLEAAWIIGSREGIGSEQHALYVALQECPPYCVVTLPQSASNSYPFSPYEQDYTKDCSLWAWKPGRFLMHLPGMPNDKRVEIFTRVLPEIVR